VADRAGRCLSSVAAAALVGLLGGCSEESLPNPVAWNPTIKELFAAHCVRCHGAGGTLNTDPLVFGGTDAPALAYLDRYEDTGDCTLDPATMSVPASCKRGALFVKDSIRLFVKAKDAQRMPPAPSDPLNDYELALVLKWCDNPLRGDEQPGDAGAD
jgi:hypothetical protein